MSDPGAPGSGTEASPYAALVRAGLTPHSRQDEVQKASFALLSSGGMSPAERAAWNELRHVERRLLADLFLHPEPDSAAPVPPPAPLEAYAFGPPLPPLDLPLPGAAQKESKP